MFTDPTTASPEGGAIPARHGPRVPPVMVGAVLVGLVASGALVWRGTSAAFTAQTSNAANAWTTGSVALTDDDGAAAMFTATGLLPGDQGENCITVDYDGSVATSVKLYRSASADVDTVAQHIDLVITEGTGGGFGDCTGFVADGAAIYSGTLATFTTTKLAYASGVGAWAPDDATDSKVYKFEYTLNAATPDAKQGKTTTATFQWEAQAGS